jgi:hypothetical protein
MFHTNVLQGGIESDSMDQMRTKLKRYTTEIEALRGKGIGRVPTLLLRVLHMPFRYRSLPLQDRKNQPFHELLLRYFGANQVAELATICTKDALESKQDRDHLHEMKIREEKIDQLTRQNRELQAELDRLKASLAEHSSSKAPANRVLHHPIPAGAPATTRVNTQRRTSLKPTSVQFFGSKPGGS